MFVNSTDIDSIIKNRFGLDIFSRSRKAKNKTLAESVIRANKRIAKERIRENIHFNENLKEFFKWICSIQDKLHLNDSEFAKELGLNSSRSIRQYRNLEGHFPSKKTLIRLLRLERLAYTCVFRSRRYANG